MIAVTTDTENLKIVANADNVFSSAYKEASESKSSDSFSSGSKTVTLA